jgi:hypothetical protein
MDVKNKRLSDGEFEALRKEVLAQWPTGKDVDLEEAVALHKSMPDHRIFSKKLLEAKRSKSTLIQPRAGVPVIEEHIKLMQFLESEGEADLLPTTIDSYTRQNRYEEAENGVSESVRLGRAMLNGFPAVNHGVAGCRRVTESVDVPIQVRHGTPDARLLTEITLAGGFTSYEGGGVSYNLPYCKNVPLERTIIDWQYTDRLTGLYEEMGVKLRPIDVSEVIFRKLWKKVWGVRDMTYLLVVGKGLLNGKYVEKKYELKTYSDDENKLTSMELATAYPIAIGAMMAAKDNSGLYGVIDPESYFIGEKFDEMVAHLGERGLYVYEK